MIEELNAEDQRTIAERLSEEELTVFDLLTRPAQPELELTEEERDEVKAVSKQLLTTLKQGEVGFGLAQTATITRCGQAHG